MGDPATVIEQYRRYVQDGRLEISEVMASELSDLLLAKKGKSVTEYGHLVTALRDLANIQEMRSKWGESRAVRINAGKIQKTICEIITLKRVERGGENKLHSVREPTKFSGRARARGSLVLHSLTGNGRVRYNPI